MTILDRRLLIVGGKGGTGKSTIAAAIGELSALRGARTLIVSADGSPGAAGMFGIEPTPVAVEISPTLSVLRVDRLASLTEFVGMQMGPLSAVASPIARAFSFVADAAPGVAELLLVGKYTHEVRTGDWDLVVVDGSSTGHLLGELASPGEIRDLAPVGRIADETGWMLELLADESVTGVVNVTIAEELPVAETLEFVDRLHEESPVRLAAVLVNRTRPQLYARAQRAAVDDLLAAPPKRLTIGAAGLLDGVRIGVDRADVSATVDRQLREGLPKNVPVLHVPEMISTFDIAAVREAIADELSL